VEQQVASGAYESAEAYLSALVEEDHRRKAKERLEQMMLDGLHSGEPREVTPQFWDELRRELQER
jgi:antitoxin ParD1/3/4